MGADEYHPMSHSGTNLSEAGGIGYTVVDSMDTMLIMGLKDEYGRARKWVEERLSFEKNGSYSTFEVSNVGFHRSGLLTVIPIRQLFVCLAVYYQLTTYPARTLFS